jgi:hypothetical protein
MSALQVHTGAMPGIFSAAVNRGAPQTGAERMRATRQRQNLSERGPSRDGTANSLILEPLYSSSGPSLASESCNGIEGDEDDGCATRNRGRDNQGGPGHRIRGVFRRVGHGLGRAVATFRGLPLPKLVTFPPLPLTADHVSVSFDVGNSRDLATSGCKLLAYIFETYVPGVRPCGSLGKVLYQIEKVCPQHLYYAMLDLVTMRNHCQHDWPIVVEIDQLLFRTILHNVLGELVPNHRIVPCNPEAEDYRLDVYDREAQVVDREEQIKKLSGTVISLRLTISQKDAELQHYYNEYGPMTGYYGPSPRSSPRRPRRFDGNSQDGRSVRRRLE